MEASLEHDSTASARAKRLGVSEVALDLIRASDVIDLHLDTFISWRLVRYDFRKRHGSGPFGRHLFGHSDLPRLIEGGYTGGMWSITTNPFRTAKSRWRVFEKNLAAFRKLVDGSNGALRFARNVAEYREAKAANAHPVMLAIQGGNALDAAPQGVASIPDRIVTRVTLVHLLHSSLGATATPLPGAREGRLTDHGRAFVSDLNRNRVFVDLAHIHPVSFWDAVEVHDRSQPLIVTHTGMTAVKQHWRNIDDRQLKAVADTGGTVGIMYQPGFLQREGGPTDGRMIAEHIRHAVKVAGDDFVSLGSDYDGFISPPADVAGVDRLPKLVQHLLDEGLSEKSVRKVLGANFLRAFGLLRPVNP